ncbi:MAG: LuxR C-terminal-related transcriptional regulator [Clostridiales bacterium]|nr:LuxR C-terminal-related transcriptional regulator [Clostridiales bacterium]
MRHVFLYFNALIIPVIVAGLVVVAVLRKVRKLDSFYKDIELFLIAMTLAAVTNLPLYYDSEITHIGLGIMTYGIGWDLIWMLYAYFWFRLVANHVEGRLGKALDKICMAYIVSCVTGWAISLFFAQEQFVNIMGIFSQIEFAIKCLCVLVSIYYLLRVNRSYENIYCLTGSLAMLLESISVNLYEGGSEFFYHAYILIWLFLAIISILVTLKASDLAVKEEEMSKTEPVKDEESVLAELKEAYRLTEREVDIYRMILHGKSNKDIGEEFYIGEATVKTHIHNLFKKLGTANRIEAMLLVNEKMNVKP